MCKDLGKGGRSSQKPKNMVLQNWRGWRGWCGERAQQAARIEGVEIEVAHGDLK